MNVKLNVRITTKEDNQIDRIDIKNVLQKSMKIQKHLKEKTQMRQ